jgi:esterase/lipase superfamily enzyme
MIISTYDEKKTATFDLKGLAEYFQAHIDAKEIKKQSIIATAEAYFNGYKDAIYTVKNMLEASNYRVEEDKR